MSVSVDGKISISIRDITVFSDVSEFQRFITDNVQSKLIEAASSMYSTTTRGAGTFQIQPLRTRCVGDFGTGFRGVEVSIGISGRFG